MFYRFHRIKMIRSVLLCIFRMINTFRNEYDASNNKNENIALRHINFMYFRIITIKTDAQVGNISEFMTEGKKRRFFVWQPIGSIEC